MRPKWSRQYSISVFLPTGDCIKIRFMQRAQERGATAVEYGVLVALIAAVIVTSVGILGQGTIELFRPVTDFFADLP